MPCVKEQILSSAAADHCQHPDRTVRPLLRIRCQSADPFMMLTVGIGEVLSCGVIGLVLQSALKNYSHVIFRDTAKSLKRL